MSSLSSDSSPLGGSMGASRTGMKERLILRLFIRLVRRLEGASLLRVQRGRSGSVSVVSTMTWERWTIWRCCSRTCRTRTTTIRTARAIKRIRGMMPGDLGSGKDMRQEINDTCNGET